MQFDDNADQCDESEYIWKIYLLHIHWPVLNHIFNGKCQHFRENTQHKRMLKDSKIFASYYIYQICQFVNFGETILIKLSFCTDHRPNN